MAEVKAQLRLDIDPQYMKILSALHDVLVEVGSNFEVLEDRVQTLELQVEELMGDRHGL